MIRGITDFAITYLVFESAILDPAGSLCCGAPIYSAKHGPRKALPVSSTLARFVCAYTIAQVRCMFRVRIFNFRLVCCLCERNDTLERTQRWPDSPSQKRGFEQRSFAKREEELCFQTRRMAGVQFSRLCLC